MTTTSDRTRTSIECQQNPELTSARDNNVPVWVIDYHLTEYVLAARHFAEFGEWPNGIKPKCPSLRGLDIWQCKWVKKQHNAEALATWRRAAEARKKERRKTEPKVKRTAQSSVFPSYTSTPDDWRAEVAARQQVIEDGQQLGLPGFVTAGGFTEYVLASREFAKTGIWPSGKPPVRAPFVGLSIWQIKWIRLQQDPVKFAEWEQMLENRHADRSALRREAREALVRDIGNTPYDQPLPIAISPLGQYVERRSRRAG